MGEPIAFLLGVLVGIISGVGIMYLMELLKVTPDPDDLSVAEKIDRVQRAMASEIVVEGPRPFVAIEIDEQRDGLVVTDANGVKWFTLFGFKWYRIPDYEERGGPVVDDFLLRVAMPTFHNIPKLRRFIEARGGRITFVPPAEPEYEQSESDHPYRAPPVAK